MVLTESATNAVRELVANATTVPATTGGLRLYARSQTWESDSLALELASGPADDERVCGTSGARVFVDRETYARVAGRQLDAESAGRRGYRFWLVPVPTRR